MTFEIGQIWQVSWDTGDHLAPGVKGRRGVLLGMDIEADGMPTKLYFSCPMVPGSKTNEVYVRNWPVKHSQLIGQLEVTYL
jgi:hypothetical protein